MPVNLFIQSFLDLNQYMYSNIRSSILNKYILSEAVPENWAQVGLRFVRIYISVVRRTLNPPGHKVSKWRIDNSISYGCCVLLHKIQASYLFLFQHMVLYNQKCARKYSKNNKLIWFILKSHVNVEKLSTRRTIVLCGYISYWRWKPVTLKKLMITKKDR